MRPGPSRGLAPVDAGWMWSIAYGPPHPRGDARPAIRIGDAERDHAVAALGDHFAAGRLSQEELEQRIDQAMIARVQGDLDPLFVDLPGTAPEPTAPAAGVRPARRGPPPLLRLAPVLLVLAVAAAVVLGAPWLLWTFVWVLLFTGFFRHRRPYGGPHYRR